VSQYKSGQLIYISYTKSITVFVKAKFWAKKLFMKAQTRNFKRNK